jgi:hypothetical protein
MSSLTLSIPSDIKNKMSKFKYVNWSAVARVAIADKIQMLEKMDRLLSKSTLTEKDAINYGRRVNKAIWKKHKANK